MKPTMQNQPDPSDDDTDAGTDTGADAGSDAGSDSSTPNVTPAEQQQYDTVVTACLQLIFGKTSFPNVVDKLVGQKDNIAVVIGHTAAMVMQSVNGGIKKQGKMIPADVLYGAGQEVVSALVELAVHLNVCDQAHFQKVYQAALFEGVRLWGQSMGQSGDITPGLQSQSQQDLAQVGVKRNAPPGGAPTTPAAPAAPAPAAPAGPGIVNQGM